MGWLWGEKKDDHWLIRSCIYPACTKCLYMPRPEKRRHRRDRSEEPGELPARCPCPLKWDQWFSAQMHSQPPGQPLMNTYTYGTPLEIFILPAWAGPRALIDFKSFQCVASIENPWATAQIVTGGLEPHWDQEVKYLWSHQNPNPFNVLYADFLWGFPWCLIKVPLALLGETEKDPSTQAGGNSLRGT